jgi:hypothetical protein
MESNHYISGYCSIEDGLITVNGQPVLQAAGISFAEFAKQAYRQFEVSYPKFFKMDNLSKLSFLAAGLLLRNEVKEGEENDIALLFANRSSSLDTDVKFNEQIADRDNYYPSPAVFVYTLPNICLGEISIRYKLYTENSFFIFADFNPGFFANYAAVLLEGGHAGKVLCGWVEFYKDTYKAFMYMVAKEGTMEHTADTINTLYQNLNGSAKS